MIRLVVLDQTNNREHELDTYGNENVNVTLQIDDVRNIESKNASFSKEFNLPATKNNNKFFEHFYNVNRHATNYNVYKNLKAFLYVDNILVLEGLMRLVNSSDKSTEISYTVVLFNDVAGIIETLGDDTIEHLNFNDINHEFTKDNIIASWNDGVTLASGGTTKAVYYPLVNTGNIYGVIAFVQQNLVGLSIDSYKNFLFNLQLKYIIDKIFEHSGFTYDSNFFNSDDFKNIYFDVGAQQVETVGTDNTLFTIVADTAQGAQSINLPPAFDAMQINTTFENASIINYLNESGDTDNLFNQATSTFTAAVDCTLDIEFNVKARTSAGEGVLEIYANDTMIGYTWCGALLNSNYTCTSTMFLSAGDTVQFKLVANGNDNIFVFNLGPVPNAIGLYRPILTLNVLDSSSSSFIHAKRGKIKLADILKDVFKAFNLSIESVGNNVLKLEPYSDYVTNNTLDWTRKVNINEMVLEPLEIPKKLVFTHAKDTNDHYHKTYKDNQLTDYGTQIIELDVDSSEIQEIALNVFSAPFIKNVDNTEVNLQHVAKLEDEELKPFDNKPRLIYKNPQGFPAPQVAVDQNETELFNAETTINSGTHYVGSDDANAPLPQITSSSNSLLFGNVNIVNTPTIGAQPNNTLFNKYWFTYINEKFNVTNGLLVKVQINLTATDIFAFRFSSAVRIQDQLYRVNKIEYNTDKNSQATVELLRI